MDTGPLGLDDISCQILTHLNNLSPFKVQQLAENLGHMRDCDCFQTLKARPYIITATPVWLPSSPGAFYPRHHLTRSGCT
jgi:hypothetical protein